MASPAFQNKGQGVEGKDAGGKKEVGGETGAGEPRSKLFSIVQPSYHQEL